MSTNPARFNALVTPVFNRLTRLAALGGEGDALIRGLSDFHRFRAGEELAGERDALGKPCFLAAGWAARVRWLPDGRRQIFNFILPGDSLGLSLRPQPLSLSTVMALTRVQTVDATPVQKAINNDDPRWDGLRNAIHLSASYEEAYLLAQIMRLGRQTAYERIGHIMLELRDRLAAAGFVTDRQFAMPLTQEMLADATGLSIVHVNRILQQLRRDRLVDFHSGEVKLLDADSLKAVADYREPQPAACGMSAG